MSTGPHSDRSTFQQCALASGLLTQPQLAKACQGVRWADGDEPDANAPPSDRQLADRLVDMGLLNVWQAKQLLDGRTKFNLGPYLIVDSIGQGGMGQVFKARHYQTGGIAAVKVLPRDKSTPEAVDNFNREIRAMMILNHPKLVAALDAGEDGNVHYLATEYVPGMDLRKLVRRDGPLEMSIAASIVYQVAEGLDYLHNQGIVHRDVKPGNVLVSPSGEAKLSDVGLAASLNDEFKDDPRHGKIVGTADYLSPDHVRNPWQPSPAWDIYSLGCTLYYAVTGKVPFPGGTTSDKARAHCDLRPLDPRRLNADLNAAFVEVMADMMAKDPAQRIGSAREVMTRLQPFLPLRPGQWPMAVPPPPPIAAPPLTAQHRFVPTAAKATAATAPSLRKAHKPIPVAALADTITELPSIQVATPSEESSNSSNSVETFELNTESDDQASPSHEIALRRKRDFMTILWPITVFFLTPLALAGLVFLVWKLAQVVT